MKWTDAEMLAFIANVGPLGIPLADSLMVYTAESGLDPRASSGDAFGIPQLTQIAAKEIGWTRPLHEFGTLGVTEQCPWIAILQSAQIRMIGYVPKNALELYVANLSPKAAKERSEVIYREGTAAYKKNFRLDRAKKGWIAASDLAVSLDNVKNSAVYTNAVDQLNRLMKEMPK